MSGPPSGSAGPRTAPAERTVLAWSRTTAAYGVVGMLLLRLVVDSVPLVLGVATGVAVGTGTVGLVARARWRLARGEAATGPSQPAVGAAITLAGTVAALGLAAAVLILFP